MPHNVFLIVSPIVNLKQRRKTPFAISNNAKGLFFSLIRSNCKAIFIYIGKAFKGMK